MTTKEELPKLPYCTEEPSDIVEELQKLEAEHEAKVPPCDQTIRELMANSVFQGASVENLTFEIETFLELLSESFDCDSPKQALFEIMRHKFGVLSVIVHRLSLLAKDPAELRKNRDWMEGGWRNDSKPKAAEGVSFARDLRGIAESTPDRATAEKILRVATSLEMKGSGASCDAE